MNNQNPNTNNNNDKTKKPHFIPNNLPTDPDKRLKLFKANDFFLYEKKFFNILPFDILPSRSFKFSYDSKKLCDFNKDIMTFGLNKISDIVTDLNMNTSLKNHL